MTNIAMNDRTDWTMTDLSRWLRDSYNGQSFKQKHNTDIYQLAQWYKLTRSDMRRIINVTKMIENDIADNSDKEFDVKVWRGLCANHIIANIHKYRKEHK